MSNDKLRVRRSQVPRVYLDRGALCAALHIRQNDERTREFLALVEHDLRYLTRPAYRTAFDRRMRADHERRYRTDLEYRAAVDANERRKIERRKYTRNAPAQVEKLRRGRPKDRVARSLVALFLMRAEAILELAGVSKRGGPLYKAFTIYLATAGKSKPDRHIAWSATRLSNEEKLWRTQVLDDPRTHFGAGPARILDDINRVLTKSRRR